MARTAEALEAFFRTVLEVPAHRMFGLALEGWSEGEARLSFVADAASLGPAGDVHGGVVGLLLEPAAMFALMTLLPEDRYAVTADVHTQLMRPIQAGARVDLRGRVLRAGRSLAFCEAEALADGKTCALAQMTKAIVVARS
ncbi:MAG TPA: PaaI family thioesterase [Caulobacteraceae bacterium]|jgi:uncharacterized protein (TIGR00369 family)